MSKTVEDWEKRQLIAEELKLTQAQLNRLEAWNNTKHPWAYAIVEHPVFVLAMFVTLWLSQILTWAFLMMRFKKDIW